MQRWDTDHPFTRRHSHHRVESVWAGGGGGAIHQVVTERNGHREAPFEHELQSGQMITPHGWQITESGWRTSSGLITVDSTAPPHQVEGAAANRRPAGQS